VGDSRNIRTPLANVRNINLVSVTLVALLVVGGYLGWKLVPVYWQAQKVDRALSAVVHEAAGLDLHRRDLREDRLLERLQAEIVGLGVADHLLQVYFAPDYSSVHADYTVEVGLLLVGTRPIEFRRHAEVPQTRF
jgi:hypothetical protein